MKKINNLIAVVFASSMLWAPITQAGPYYITINAGASKLKSFCSNSATGFSCKDSVPAYGLDVGYQFSDRFGLELGYADYGAPVTKGQLFGSNLEVSQKLAGLKLAGTATFPLSKSFAFTGKAGISATNLNVVSSAAPGPAIPSYSVATPSLTYGVGVKYDFNKSVALRVQYENIGKTGDETIGTDSLSLLTVGFTYYFGQKAEDRPGPKKLSAPLQPPMRVIVFVERASPANNQLLTAAIAEACKCQAIFVRNFSSNAFVYQVDLAPGQTFSSLKSALLPGDPSLGLKELIQGE